MITRAFVARRACAADVRHVILRMREQSAREAFATRYDDDRLRMANEFCEVLKRLEIYALGEEVDGIPYPALALLACGEIGNGIATMLWMATDEWPRIKIATHRFWRHWFMPKVMSRYRRVEFLGGAGEEDRRWLQFTGFTLEGIAYRYGKTGADFCHYAWVNPEWKADV